ncbi:MmgE/PrpD family protein [Patescibacteria group bacterium AH-259-L05]|nr:MmgE/PrpD family protein [Patescibacteria group bacterium AH-259-L05]
MKQIRLEMFLDLLVDFAKKLRFEDLPDEVVDQAKRRCIDAIACAAGGWYDEGVQATHSLLAYYPVDSFPAGAPLWKDMMSTPWDAAYFNTHLIRALDWNDTYLSLEPAHPSDNIGTLLALCGLEKISGKDFLTAVALAYEVHCRFCDAASLRARGWDHVIYVNIASTFAAAKVLGLSHEKIREAVALALNSGIVMRQVRAGDQVSQEKGASAAKAVRAAVWGALSARHGMTGPREIFEGKFGFIKQVSGPLRLEVFSDLGEIFKLPQTYIKVYPVEYHAQAVVEAALKLRKKIKDFNIRDIDRIHIESYEAARTIIGDAPKRRPETKESADHSIYYVLALTLIDGEMTLDQYEPRRFTDPAVRALIDKMTDVKEVEEFNRAYFNAEFPVRIIVHMCNGKKYSVTIRNPVGHPARPLSNNKLKTKFRNLCISHLKGDRVDALFETLQSLDEVSDMRDIIQLWRRDYE